MADARVSVTSLSAGSDSVYDIICQPCDSEGKNVEAEVFCLECCEHLCVQCLGFHKKLSSLKHHEIQNKDSMQQKPGTPQLNDVCTERCQIHKDEIIKYFCPIHKVLGCIVCVTLKHSSCNVRFIPDIAHGLEDSIYYRKFMTKLNKLTQKSKDTVKLTEEIKKQAFDCREKATQNIDAYRQELMNNVDKQVKELKDRAKQIHTHDTYKMKSMADNSKKIMVELQSLSSDLTSLHGKRQFCQMFVEMRNNGHRLAKLQGKLEDMACYDVSDYDFHPDQQVPAMIRKQNGLGQLVMNKTLKQRKATHVADISVHSAGRTHTCRITGVALLSASQLVAADNSNGTIKLVDITNKKVTSELKLEEKPWDVTVCGDEVAATLPIARKIVFLKGDSGLVRVRDVSVNGHCKGISCADGKLFVVYDMEKKLEIMTVTGIILQKIERNDQGDQILKNHIYVTVSAANQSIYASVYGYNLVTVLGLDGKMKMEYMDDQVGRPGQLAADNDGVMYLCDYYTDTIYLLSPLCQKVKVLLSGRDGLDRPWSVCYCENTRRLYVGMVGDNIKVYEFS